MGRKAVFVDAFMFLVHNGQMISGFAYGPCCVFSRDFRCFSIMRGMDLLLAPCCYINIFHELFILLPHGWLQDFVVFSFFLMAEGMYIDILCTWLCFPRFTDPVSFLIIFYHLDHDWILIEIILFLFLLCHFNALQHDHFSQPWVKVDAPG